MAEKVIIDQPGSYVLPDGMKAKGQVPPGLDYLSQIDQVIIKQQVELLEAITGFETNNRYKISNNQGQQIYFAQEETSCLMRNCCGSGRKFTMHITDNSNQEVMRVHRPFKCCGGCSWCASADCAAFELQVEAPVGTVIGYVRQMRYWCKPTFGVFDTDHNLLAHINGPCCVCSCPCCGDVDFPMVTIADRKEDQQLIGNLSKQWTGLALEMFTDADTFNIRFPKDMDPKIKATLFGAIFMIDFMFFESNDDNNNN